MRVYNMKKYQLARNFRCDVSFHLFPHPISHIFCVSAFIYSFLSHNYVCSLFIFHSVPFRFRFAFRYMRSCYGLSRQLQQKQKQHFTINNQKQLKKTHSIFVDDEGYAKQEYECQLDNTNKKSSSTVTQQYQQPFKTNITYSMAQKRAGLEIPTREDEDNKSQHSYRQHSMSSSRRQSTEESIDTDDEYFCYEMRKLEELERIEKERRKQMDQSNRYNCTLHTPYLFLSSLQTLNSVLHCIQIIFFILFSFCCRSAYRSKLLVAFSFFVFCV